MHLYAENSVLIKLIVLINNIKIPKTNETCIVNLDTLVSTAHKQLKHFEPRFYGFFILPKFLEL